MESTAEEAAAGGPETEPVEPGAGGGGAATVVVGERVVEVVAPVEVVVFALVDVVDVTGFTPGAV